MVILLCGLKIVLSSFLKNLSPIRNLVYFYFINLMISPCAFVMFQVFKLHLILSGSFSPTFSTHNTGFQLYFLYQLCAQSRHFQYCVWPCPYIVNSITFMLFHFYTFIHLFILYAYVKKKKKVARGYTVISLLPAVIRQSPFICPIATVVVSLSWLLLQLFWAIHNKCVYYSCVYSPFFCTLLFFT